MRWVHAEDGAGITRYAAAPGVPLVAALCALAGPAAESLAFPAIDEHGARFDRADADRSAFAIARSIDGMDEVLAAVWTVSRELLTDRWHHVEELAIRLLKKANGSLNADELAQLERPPLFDLVPFSVVAAVRGAEGSHGPGDGLLLSPVARSVVGGGMTDG